MGPLRRMLSSLGPSKGGSRSLTLCLGHFKEKFSSMNIQPMSKHKFVRSEPASCVAGSGAPTARTPPVAGFFRRVSQTLPALQPRWFACPLLCPPPGTPSSHREASPNSPACSPCKQPSQSNSNPSAPPWPALGVALLEADGREQSWEGSKPRLGPAASAELLADHSHLGGLRLATLMRLPET